MKRKAPWLDFDGKDIHEGDTIVHPSGERGNIYFLSDENSPTDQRRVFYAEYGAHHSSLCLQVGSRGRAVVLSCDTENNND